MEQYDAIDRFRVEYPIVPFDSCLAISRISNYGMNLVAVQFSVIDNLTANCTFFYRHKNRVDPPMQRARTQWEEGLC